MSRGPSTVHGAVDKATDNGAFQYAARAGFAVSGVLHLLLGYIVLRLALGTGGNADQSRALATLADQTGGQVMLWIAAVGLFALGLWRLAEAVLGSSPASAPATTTHRPGSAPNPVGLAVANIAIAFSAMRFAMGSGQSSGRQNSGHLGAADAVRVGQGSSGRGRPRGAGRRRIPRLQGRLAEVLQGSAGIRWHRRHRRRRRRVRRQGLVLAGAGILVIVATLQADPAKASGLDAAVKTLGEAPYGKFLLILAALGIAAFGAVQLRAQPLRPAVTGVSSARR